jgi:hypothetical protein
MGPFSKRSRRIKPGPGSEEELSAVYVAFARTLALILALTSARSRPSTRSRPWPPSALPGCLWLFCAAMKFAQCSPIWFIVHSTSPDEQVAPASAFVMLRAQLAPVGRTRPALCHPHSSKPHSAGRERASRALRGRPASSRWMADEAGTVTAEFAAVIPAVILILACCCAAIQLSVQQLRLQDVTASAARSIARGDDASVATALFPRALFVVSQRAELLCVSASAPAAVGPGLMAAVTLTAESCSLAAGE